MILLMLFVDSDTDNSADELIAMSDISETTRLVTDRQRSQSTNGNLHTPPGRKEQPHTVKDMVDSSGKYSVNNSAFEGNEDGGRMGRDETSSKSPQRVGSSSDDERMPSSRKQQTTLFVWLLSAFAAIGGFLFGYDTGVVSGAMLLLKDEFSLTSVQQEIIVSVTIGGAFLSALCGGYLSDRFGRKFCTLFASFVFTAGALILGVAQNVAMLIAGRLVLGIGIGMYCFSRY